MKPGGAEAELEAARRGLNDLLSCVQLARGAAWISAGRYREAYRALRRALDPADASYHQRERFTSLMLFAEAAVRVSRRGDARRVVAELEEIAVVTPSPILHVHLLYARAVLADDHEAEELFLAALGEDLSRWPLVEAKLRLAYGAWLLEQGRVVPARVVLGQARTCLDRIGAAPWVDEAHLRLRAAGEQGLKPACEERKVRVAALVADSLSDPEIAEELLLPMDVVALYRRAIVDETR